MRTLLTLSMLFSSAAYAANMDYWESVLASSELERQRAHQVHQPIEAPKSSDFGLRFHPILQKDRLHRGVDFAAEEGTPFFSAGAGVVMYAEARGDLGLTIAIKHENGMITRYAHASSALVQQGEQVDRYTPIGRVGTSGLSTGPHLHFELIKEGKHVNPEEITSFYNPNEDNLTLEERINTLLTDQQKNVLSETEFSQIAQYISKATTPHLLYTAQNDVLVKKSRKTTWAIAADLVSGTELTVYQSLYAIMEANPELFPTKNINLRYEGELLVPDVDTIAKQCPEDSKARFYGLAPDQGFIASTEMLKPDS